MANYCSNSVRFIGVENSVEEIRQLFDDIDKKQMRSNRYHMPDFVKGGTGYMEDIAVGPEWISYETSWVPNLEVLDDIADHYGMDYIAWYQEPMAGLYGEAVRTAGETQWVNIDTYTQKGRGNNPAFFALKELQASLLINQGPER
ncbi:MAG: hypothetical protein NVSMB24_38720 [Mucilaginibacter sp.]